MVIQCTLSGSLNCLQDYVNKILVESPSPTGITKTNAYLGKQGADHKIFILYEINNSHFSGAMEYICKQLGPLVDFPGSILFSAHSYGPHPSVLKLENGGEV